MRQEDLLATASKADVGHIHAHVNACLLFAFIRADLTLVFLFLISLVAKVERATSILLLASFCLGPYVFLSDLILVLIVFRLTAHV